MYGGVKFPIPYKHSWINSILYREFEWSGQLFFALQDSEEPPPILSKRSTANNQ